MANFAPTVKYFSGMSPPPKWPILCRVGR